MAQKSIKAVMDELTAMGAGQKHLSTSVCGQLSGAFRGTPRRVLSRYANEDAGNS